MAFDSSDDLLSKLPPPQQILIKPPETTGTSPEDTTSQISQPSPS